MPRGGKRTGAGRKRGGLTKKTTEVARQAVEQGITPLEVMLKVMATHYEAERWDKAAAIAKDAAPYVHPRLSSVQVQQVSDDDLDGEIDRRLALLAARKQTPTAGATAGSNGQA